MPDARLLGATANESRDHRVVIANLSPRLRNRLGTALSSGNPLHLFNQAPNWATETG